MPFPKTKDDLFAQGYKFGRATSCRACRAKIEFWMTPRGKYIPLNAGTLESHWSTCPKAAEFRRGEEKEKTSTLEGINRAAHARRRSQQRGFDWR